MSAASSKPSSSTGSDHSGSMISFHSSRASSPAPSHHCVSSVCANEPSTKVVQGGHTAVYTLAAYSCGGDDEGEIDYMLCLSCDHDHASVYSYNQLDEAALAKKMDEKCGCRHMLRISSGLVCALERHREYLRGRHRRVINSYIKHIRDEHEAGRSVPEWSFKRFPQEVQDKWHAICRAAARRRERAVANAAKLKKKISKACGEENVYPHRCKFVVARRETGAPWYVPSKAAMQAPNSPSPSVY